MVRQALHVLRTPSTVTAVRRTIAALAVAAVVAVATPACGDSGDRLTVYSGRTEDLIAPLLERFAEETGLGIDVRYGQSADLALLIAEEGDRSPADVFLSQSPGPIGYLEQEGLLDELPAGALELVDPRYRSDDGRWVGVSGRQRVLVYNRDIVDPADLPASVLDLTDAAYAGQVAVAPSNGSFQDFVSAMREHLGDDATLDWLTGMADNDSPVYANNTAIVEAVGRGEVAMGLVNHYYNVRARAEDPDLPSENHVFPGGDVGALVIVTGIGVLGSADQPDEAVELVEYLLSEEAQEYFTEETMEYPVVDGVEPAGDLPRIDELDAPEEDLNELGADLVRTQELIAQSGIEQG